MKVNSGVCDSGRARAPREPWPRVKLGEVCEEIHDRIASAKIEAVNYVTTDNMLKNCAGVAMAEYVPEDVGLVHYLKGDVLLANIRPYLKKLWRADKDGGCSSDVVVFRSCSDGLSSEYLFAALSQDCFFDYVMEKPRGTKMPRGDREWMKKFEFPLPPLSVQHEIVARLEKELGAVDKLAKKFEELEQNAEAEFKAELNETFEKVLRDGVETRKLGDLCERVTKGTTPTSVGFSFIESGVNFVKVESFSDDGYLVKEKVSHVSMECHAALARSQLKKDDVLFSIAGALGRIAKVNEEILPANTNQALAIIRLKNDVEIGVDYLMLALRSPSVTLQVDDMKKETAQANLSLQNIRDFEIAFPPMDVQRSIVTRLDAARERKEKLVSAAKRGRESAALLRKAILKEAFE